MFFYLAYYLNLYIMKKFFSKKSNIGFTIFAAIVLFAFSGQHPTTSTGGYTGAPNDSACTQCHSPGGSLEGTVEISGLPASVTPNSTYPLTVTITNTSGSATRAGFQMVSLKANLANGGTFTTPAAETSAVVKTAGGKSYIGHEPAKNFAANVVTYMAEWTAPASATGDLTVYAGAIIANGANGNSNDKFVATSVSTVLSGGSDPLTATFTFDAPTSCSDTDDGKATISPVGGSGNYSYAWDNGETNAAALMLSAGNHSVTVTDDSNTSISESIFIGSPDPILLNIISQSDAICNGANTGTAEVLATDGNGGFTYNWGNGITGDIQNNLFAGTYNLTATDINNCQQSIMVTIDEPQPIVINITNQTLPSCNGDSDGSISVEAVGGNGDFSYTWLTGMGIANGGTITDLPAGTYALEAFDDEGCNNEISITLNEPSILSIDISSTSPNCFGGADGSATAMSSGGTGSISYAWSNGSNDATQSNLTAGNYEVTATDENNCTIIESVSINEPMSAVTAGILVTNQPNCGNADGTLSAFGDDGTPGYTFLWNDGSTNAVLTNIPAGDYSVTVTDSNGCTSSTEASLTENEGIQLAANNVINNECNGGSLGSASISAAGGEGTYTYIWSNSGTNATENNLAAGAYTITVTDTGNCSGEITIEITEPLPYIANETITHIICAGANNGSISIAPTGGTGTLTYLWNIGSTGTEINNLIPGIYSVSITDELDCTSEKEFVIEEPEAILIEVINTMIPNCPGDSTGMIEISATGGTGTLSYLWSNGDTTTNISNLENGDYTISISDSNGCMVDQSFTLDDPFEIEAMATEVMPSCFDSNDGSLSLLTTGGTGNYIYSWETGGSTPTITNIASGEYNVTITDTNNCSQIFSFMLTAPSEIDPNITSMDVSQNGANDGTAMADPQNGIEPYTYLWSNDSTTAEITGLLPSIYTVTITDVNNCTVIATVVINNGDCNVTSDVDITNISCAGVQDGMISITLTGAVEPINYEWSNGETTSSVDNLGVGTYSVTATDANGCLIQLVGFEITAPEELSIENIVITDASSSEATDGSISFEIQGGTGAITIEYTDAFGQLIDVENFENIPAGIYGVIITDQNGCIKLFTPFEVGFTTSTSEVSIKASIFPNPVSDHLTIEIDNSQTLSSLPVIYDLTGRITEAPISKTNNRYTANVSNLHGGIYYIKLTNNDEIKLLKVLVVKR